MMLKYCIIVPCYNEALRLDTTSFLSFIEKRPGASILFVNDGSSDETVDIIKELQSKSPSILLFDQPHNAGKAEAIRVGALYLLDHYSFDYLAYMDADQAAPIDEIHKLVVWLTKNECYKTVIGARVKRLGAKIDRNEIRHYLGRIFVTYANSLLNLSVYDSQCGAKVFDSSICRSVFHEPFISKWFFDLELILRCGVHTISERALDEWTEVGNSKLRLKDYLTAPFEIIKIRNKYIRESK